MWSFQGTDATDAMKLQQQQQQLGEVSSVQHLKIYVSLHGLIPLLYIFLQAMKSLSASSLPFQKAMRQPTDEEGNTNSLKRRKTQNPTMISGLLN